MVLASERNDLYKPPFYCNIFIATRGFNTIVDGATDAMFHELSREFGDITIYFHQGFLQAAEYVFESISNLLDYENVYFVGHSYGAAVSNVLCVLTKLNDKYINRQVYSYAFAPPLSMSTIPGHVQECIFSFINAHDIVPHLSLYNARNTIDLMNSDIRKFFNSLMSRLEKSDTFGKSLRTLFLQYENEIASLITGASQSFHVKTNVGN